MLNITDGMLSWYKVAAYCSTAQALALKRGWQSFCAITSLIERLHHVLERELIDGRRHVHDT